MAKEIAEEYASSLSDLTVNSKPLINMLTILAEENVDHAGVIVETVEKHLEKVHSDIKLPVLYLVDSIIKNVGGAYTQKFSASIVNMFTRTFKQVDEKTRAQMFKLRETWHDVFPATKMYQLDVKVNLIDPAWPIQAQPHQSNIHVNPNFLKKPAATTSTGPTPHVPAPAAVPEEEQMRSILAKKEQELLMLQRKKIEMELEQTRRQLELAEKNALKQAPMQVAPVVGFPPTMASPALAPGALPPGAVVPVTAVAPDAVHVPAKHRLGPPVSAKAMSGRIAPVSGAMLAARRDPRLARTVPPAPAPPAVAAAPIAPHVFDIKPLERVTKRKNVITIDVRPELTGAEPRRDPRRRDPRLDKQRKDIDERVRKERDRRSARKEEEKRKRDEEKRKLEQEVKIDGNNFDIAEPKPKDVEGDFITKLHLPDPKKINKLPPIPKINREEKKEEAVPSPTKRRKEVTRQERKQKKRDGSNSSSNSPSPDKKKALRERKAKKAMEAEEKFDDEMVAFKELKNYHKERYMRRNRDKSESPEPAAPAPAPAPAHAPTNAEPIQESKDVDLRILPGVEVKPAQVNQKRASTEAAEGLAKKSKIDKFDILFGNEDVDLRQLPQVDEPVKTDPKPESPENSPRHESPKEDDESPLSPRPEGSPKKDWHDVKDKEEAKKKTPTKLDLVRAKLAVATQGKDRLGRPLMFTKSPSIEKERIRTSISEDTDLRPEPEDEVNKETISLILTQAKEYYQDGKMDKNQYNTLMFQVMQLNEKLKLKEAKQKESLELSKMKLRAQGTVASPKTSPGNNKFGDIDERVPPSFTDTPPNSQDVNMQDLDMRRQPAIDGREGPVPAPPRPPLVPRFVGQYQPVWRGPRGGPRPDDFMMRRGQRQQPPFFRHRGPRPPYEPRFPGMPQPKIGMCQGESPIPRYHISGAPPPPLGSPGIFIPPTDYRALDYIDQDPMKTIEIDGIPREIRFYGDTAVIMLDWDDPREIRFLPGSRRLNFDNKDSVVLTFNEGYKQVEFEDEIYNIKLGAPTRELFINNRWYECFFGAPPCLVVIEGKTRKIQLEGPPPQVDIGKIKRVDLCAGKINLIVDAQHMFPIFLDAKVQKFLVDGEYYTIRFVDGLRTVLINEQPFLVEFGGLPRPIYVNDRKHFIRFSVLPRNVMPGYANIYNMDGLVMNPDLNRNVKPEVVEKNHVNKMEVDEQLSPKPEPEPVAIPEIDSQAGGLDMLASVMPSSMAPASSFSGYSLAEPLFNKTDTIPGLDVEKKENEENQSIKEEGEKKDGVVTLPGLGSLNVNDLFAKLVATGIVQGPKEKEEPVQKEDKNKIHHVDLLNPKSLRVKQPGVVALLYGGMQCSGCGARFPPEQTTRYSAHLDWHFRQNRRARDSARRAHSRHWHYDLADWVRYEEVEDAEEREKSWFETTGAESSPTAGGARPASPAPVSVAAGAAPVDQHCALCGDRFPQYYHEDHEEWHLRGAVAREGKNYHPLCWDDYQASLAKDNPAPTDSTTDVTAVDKTEDGVEVVPVTELDDESDVELVDEDTAPEPVVEEINELEEEDDDDVVLKAEPVEQVLVEDDADTDDETREERRRRDREYDFSQVKVKLEPVDPDDEPEITAEEEAMKTHCDTTRAAVLSSLDGNVELAAPAARPARAIRINISKAIPTLLSEDKNLEDVSSSVEDEPPPPGEEEPELQYELKEGLRGAALARQPPVQRGRELSGLCSIM